MKKYNLNLHALKSKNLRLDLQIEDMKKKITNLKQ